MPPRALKLLLPQPPDKRPDVQYSPVPGRERVPDAVTVLDGGLHRYAQAFNGGHKKILTRSGKPGVFSSAPGACAGSPSNVAQSRATVPIRPLVATARFVPPSFAMSRQSSRRRHGAFLFNRRFGQSQTAAEGGQRSDRLG